MPSIRRGPTEDRGIAMERILKVARASFAQHGSAGTSMRAVAQEAGVDPRLVAYYFGDKERLLEACLMPPSGYLERVDEVVHGPLRGRGAAMVRNMLHYWESPDTGAVLRALTLTAVHEPIALTRLRAMYRDNMVAAVADGLDDAQRDLRGSLAASVMIGVSLTRYVYQLEPIAGLPADDVVRLVGPKVQQYLSGALPDTTTSTATGPVPRPARRNRNAREAGRKA